MLQLQADFQARNFLQFYGSNDVNEKTNILTAELKNLMDAHAPERTITVRDEKTPWITREIKEAVELRDLAYKLYARNPNRRRDDPQWLEYIRKRDQASTLIFNAKKQFADRNFDHNLPAKKLWSNLRREGVHNSSKKNQSTTDFNADDLNTFFADGHLQLRTATQNGITAEPRHRTEVDQGAVQFSFRHTDANEVCLKIYEITTSAAGSDDIPISFIKLLCPFILPHLTHLINKIIDAKIFPSIWKKGIITPIPKTSNPEQPKDFRPISVLPAISKVLEKILLGQITGHLNEANPPLLASNQSGYRKGFSTTTALAKVVHDIYSNFDDNRCTVMVLVDFSLAFNCVDHHQLKTKLRDEFHFSNEACDLIASFLNDRSQVVRLGNILSGEKELLDGTPQGSCLSALLFSLYINSLPGTLKCSWQLYADDLQIYLSGRVDEVDQLVKRINEDLESIVRWAKRNRLYPNPKKTQAIVFSKTGTVVPQEEIVFSGTAIALCNSVMNLGLQMDCNLNWTPQVNSVVRKVYGTLKTFRRFAPVLSERTRRKLAQSVIMPFFTYCDVIYYPGLSAVLREQLHRSFKSTLRFVHKLRRRDTTVAVRRSILGHDLPANYHLRICCFMKRAIDRTLPGYLLQHLQRGRQERTASFIIPRHTTSSGRSLLVYGVSQWNALPMETKHERRFNAFKRTIRRQNH